MIATIRSPTEDLCVSAALDAVKEDVTLPWSVPQSSLQNLSTETTADPAGAHTTESIAPEAESQTPGSTHPRTLHLRNFSKALKEITPSSSEILGSLTDLRKWNEEFGEGQKNKKRQVWGKGKFGFTKVGSDEPGGHVSTHTSASINTTIIR